MLLLYYSSYISDGGVRLSIPYVDVVSDRVKATYLGKAMDLIPRAHPGSPRISAPAHEDQAPFRPLKISFIDCLTFRTLVDTQHHALAFYYCSSLVSECWGVASSSEACFELDGLCSAS
jgi:hypothetical protein